MTHEIESTRAGDGKPADLPPMPEAFGFAWHEGSMTAQGYQAHVGFSLDQPPEDYGAGPVFTAGQMQAYARAALAAAPAAPSPDAGDGKQWQADVECITDESGTDYSVSIRGPGLRNPDYSDVWLKKRPAKQLAKWLNKSVLPRFSTVAAAPAVSAPAQAALDVLAERQRQISVEGWTPEHDDEHADGGMAKAAAAYAWASRGRAYHQFDEPAPAPALWPWGVEWWKPAEPRRMLVKAGALILAEIERLDRAVQAPATVAPAEGGQL